LKGKRKNYKTLKRNNLQTIPVDLQAVQHAEWILQLTKNQIILQ